MGGRAGEVVGQVEGGDSFQYIKLFVNKVSKIEIMSKLLPVKENVKLISYRIPSF